jgi:hypothetical protein
VVVTVIMVLVPGVTEVGLNFAAAPVGSPVTVNVTGFVRVPPTVAVEIANAAGWPAATVSVGVGLETAKSAIVSVRAAEVPPPGNGLNTVTKMAPPLVRSPAGTMAVTCVALTIVVVNATPFHSTTVPAKKFVPVSVSVNAAPPAFAVVGESIARTGCGLAVTPVPESSRVCGLSKASSVNVTVALRTPLAEGVNVAVIVQLALTASVAPQVDVSPKSAAFAPPRRIEVMFNVALPLFFNVTICGADVVVSA